MKVPQAQSLDSFSCQHVTSHSHDRIHRHSHNVCFDFSSLDFSQMFNWRLPVPAPLCFSSKLAWPIRGSPETTYPRVSFPSGPISSTLEIKVFTAFSFEMQTVTSLLVQPLEQSQNLAPSTTPVLISPHLSWPLTVWQFGDSCSSTDRASDLVTLQFTPMPRTAMFKPDDPSTIKFPRKSCTLQWPTKSCSIYFLLFHQLPIYLTDPTMTLQA